MKVVYPAIFTRDEGEYLVEVPDLEILTQGADLGGAVDMARDAICLKCVYLEDAGAPLPPPAPLEAIDAAQGTFADVGPGFVSLVDADPAEYRRSLENRS